jgi:hypothetical protein
MRSRRAAWLIAAALTLANPLLHKAVSDVFDWARARWGFTLYDRTALIAIPVLSVLAVLPFLAGQRRLLVRALPSLLALTAMTVAAQHWLLVVNIELIHFPQFALLAVALLAAGLSGPSAYLASTAAGVLDETYQHLVVYAGVPDTYFDVNDIVLNAIGAAWGVVLFADVFRRTSAGREGSSPSARDSRSGALEAATVGLGRWVTRPRMAALMLLALLVAVWLDPPQFTPLLRTIPSGRLMYRVMSTAEGLVVCTVLWGLVAFRMRGTKTPAPFPVAEV